MRQSHDSASNSYHCLQEKKNGCTQIKITKQTIIPIADWPRFTIQYKNDRHGKRANI